jgi:TrpR-related protein YerC/YecD
MEMMEQESFQMLFKAMLSLENEAECAAFLEDLMTRKEMEDVAQRLSVAKMLSEQAVYSRIVEKTGASTATISRVNRAYNYGTGAYSKILKRISGEKA